MKILIGIKRVSASGSYHGAKGFEGFSISASNVSVLASGTDEELKKLVKEAREQKEKLSKEISKLENRLAYFDERYDEDFDYDKEYLKVSKKYPKAAMLIPDFDKLLIVEGELL